MKIRQEHSVCDRLKLLLILLLLLVFVVAELFWVLSHNTRGKVSTMEHFLQTALEPVGTTMYIWGGGWDSEDSNAGATSTRIGVSPTWEKYAKLQDESYDFEEHKWERENGLDCSGYVGWVLYNTFETEEGQNGYVMSSTDMAKTYAEWGFGKCIKNPKEFLPGDVVSMEGHVWISLGTCEDGSVLFVHSSPPGVMVCGTEVPDSNEISKDGKSIAVQLAEDYMSTFYPGWYEKYPNCMKPSSYLENVSVLRWNSKTMTDVEEFQDMGGEEILDLL